MDNDRPLPLREKAPSKARRVYKSVTVGARDDGTFAVLLDGRPALTPLRAPLAAVSHALVAAVAAEWDAQDPHVDPEAMPLTRLLATAIDRISPQREAVIASLLSYVDADTICFRALRPADLRARQRRLWQPVLDWLLREHEVALTAADGLMPAVQSPDVAVRLRRALEGLGDAELTAFQAAASLANSLALAFALIRRHMPAADVFAAAFLDELYQAEQWGEDRLAQERRRRIAHDLAAVERYLVLSASPEVAASG